jgi:hypothetical protein
VLISKKSNSVINKFGTRKIYKKRKKELIILQPEKTKGRSIPCPKE